MKKALLLLCFLLLFLVGVGVYKIYVKKSTFVGPLGGLGKKNTEKPLERYSFDNLRKQSFSPQSITLGKPIKDDADFTSFPFYFLVDGKKVSGLMNIPKTPGTYPVLVMFRGFVPKEIYTPGEGDRRTAEYFVKQGFITLTADFLGYGQSDPESQDPMEGRFQTYTTALQLLASVKTLNTTLQATESGTIRADTEKIGIWGHSNGGHIALSVLAISAKPYPTVLWNPVSKLFPYSILYFIDEYEDHGKGLIQLVANFEKDYDAEKYSPPNYYTYITAPIQLDQAVDDEEVPIRWSNELNDTLTKLGIDVTYYTYPGENHNYNNGSWPLVVSRTAAFFATQLNN